MATCWICTHNHGSVSHDSVGCCITCHVHACDSHGDRLQKSEFWCLICLGNATVDGAGSVQTGSAQGFAAAGQRPLVHPDEVPPWLLVKLNPILAPARAAVRAAAPAARAELSAVGQPEPADELMAIGLAMLAQAFGGWDALVARAAPDHQDRLLLHPAAVELLQEAG